MACAVNIIVTALISGMSDGSVNKMDNIIAGAAGRSDSGTRPVQPTVQADETATQAARGRRRAAHRERAGRGTLLLMTLTAVLGAAGGVIAAGKCGAVAGGILVTQGSFLELFLTRVIYGGAFLLVEYILGFFALGGAVVWAVPLMCGMGTGLTLAAAGAERGALIPGAVMTLAAAVFGAELSDSLSGQLLRVLMGSRTGLVITNGTAGDYTLRFLGLLGVNIAAGLIEAGIKLGSG